MPELKGSPALSLSWHDGWKVLQGALIAAAGAGLTYLAEWVSGTDFGEWTPVVVSVSAVLVNVARKWLLNTQTLALFVAFTLFAATAQAACRCDFPLPRSGQRINRLMVCPTFRPPLIVDYDGRDWPVENSANLMGWGGDLATLRFDQRRGVWHIESLQRGASESIYVPVGLRVR